MTTAQRPTPSNITTANELKRWYWRKDELTALAKHHGLKSTGAKFDILDRIGHFLDTGEMKTPLETSTSKHSAKSSFDWHCEVLEPETIITDSYKNSQNVRRFFRQNCGEQFKFNIAFMAWMKSNIGKTLHHAVQEYNIQQDLIKRTGVTTKIQPHNQYNQYSRDFLADNPTLKMSHVRRAWAKKIELPSDNGRHIYEKSDLKRLND